MHILPPHLAVVSSQVEVDPLWSRSVPSAVAGGERDPHHSSAVAGGEPALLVVTLPAHRFLLLAFGHAALPGEAEDVRVTADDWPVLHGGEHLCRPLSPPPGKSSEEEGWGSSEALRGYYLLSSTEIADSMFDV